MRTLILSLFPGIGLLDQAFEETGFCVVRGPDLLWGGDIYQFHPPPDTFHGIIAGPPCQDFSRRRRSKPTGYGRKMLKEFLRCIDEAQPEWWLMENVDRVPNIWPVGYSHQRLNIDNGWFDEAKSRRLRHVQFGSKSGRTLNVTHRPVTPDLPGAALANDKRGFQQLCALQGLPDDFDLPGFTVEAKKRAVGNGVPLPMGRALAQAIIATYDEPAITQLRLDASHVPAQACACGCGRRVTQGRKYAVDEQGKSDACRKRAQRNRASHRSSERLLNFEERR